jgi:hypothetical protein
VEPRTTNMNQYGSVWEHMHARGDSSIGVSDNR